MEDAEKRQKIQGNQSYENGYTSQTNERAQTVDDTWIPEAYGQIKSVE